ncbi:MAG: zf-HC2 domain-containing protein, partial [Myxococcales bacterium]|nr:zf-HC2 domain-containing protein [Myxococcales bacterium]
MSRETSLPAACQRAQVQLSERKRGELDLAQQAALEAHLSSCETCRRLERGTAKLADLLRRGTPPLEASTRAAVWQRIEAESGAGAAGAPGRRWLWGFALACACALLVV